MSLLSDVFNMFVEEDSDVFFDETNNNDPNVFGELNHSAKPQQQVRPIRTGEGSGNSHEGRAKNSAGNRSNEGRGYTERSSEGRQMSSRIEQSNMAPTVKGVYPTKKAEVKNHSHPASSGNYIVEKKKTYVGSLGTVSDEGCIQHGDQRFVSAPSKVSQVATRNRLKEYVIAKEVLGKPKCKR